MLLASAHVHNTNAQAGYCLHMNYVSMFYEHVLIMYDHAYILATLSHDCDIKHTCKVL